MRTVRTASGSIEAIERVMGYERGPTPERRRGDSDRPAVLIGLTPTVHAHEPGSALGARVADVVGRFCTFVTFVLYVVVPILGALNIAFRS